MKATGKYGELNNIPNCSITVPGHEPIKFKILPDISDSKAANFTDETIMGRSFPVKTYSHSENRSISIDLHFIALKKSDIDANLKTLRLLQSLTYPRDGANGAPYLPPPVCHIVCGEILGKEGVCAILRNYNIKHPTDQVIDEETLLAYKFDLTTQWEVVYASSRLPGAEKIIMDGA